MTLGRNALSLNIERRRIPPRNAQQVLVFTKLPLPPSRDILSKSAADIARSRLSWFESAAAVIRANRAQRVRGPVVVTLKFEECRRVHHGVETLAKAPLELLAELGLIDSADAHTVRQLILCWGAVDGLDIRVEPVRADPAPAAGAANSLSAAKRGAV